MIQALEHSLSLMGVFSKTVAWSRYLTDDRSASSGSANGTSICNKVSLAESAGAAMVSSVDVHCEIADIPSSPIGLVSDVDMIGTVIYTVFEVETWRIWYVLFGVHNTASEPFVTSELPGDLSCSLHVN